jgi:hypothetical protein
MSDPTRPGTSVPETQSSANADTQNGQEMPVEGDFYVVNHHDHVTLPTHVARDETITPDADGAIGEVRL